MNTKKLDGPAQAKAVTDAVFARLSKRANRVPVVAFMGEFSAGKSTLMNFLLEKNVLPTRVIATKLPPIWLSYGCDESYRIRKDGSRCALNLESTDKIPVSDTRFLRIFCEADILKECDLIDMPGISDPNLDRNDWIKTANYANMVIWCTHATPGMAPDGKQPVAIVTQTPAARQHSCDHPRRQAGFRPRAAKGPAAAET